MKAAIVSIGAEVLNGTILNSNSQWLSRMLEENGYEISQHQSLPDDPPVITEHLEKLLFNDLILITGGLGPTFDDKTRSALALLTQSRLVENPDALKMIRERFESRNRRMPEINTVQALIPENGDWITNVSGTAPGIFLQKGNCSIYAMPGVPGEMKNMFLQQILPRLKTNSALQPASFHCFSLFGIPESKIQETLDKEGMDLNSQNPSFSLLPNFGVVRMALKAKGKTEAEREALLSKPGEKIRALFGKFIFSEKDETLEEALGALLLGKKLKIALAESCTGGLLSHKLTQVPGISDSYPGGITSYSNEAKINFLKVPKSILQEHGAVSEATALAMATGVREMFDADIALSVTGIAGPGGGSAEKPVGLVWFGVTMKGKKPKAMERRFLGNRAEIKEWGAQCALDFGRREILGLNGESR